MSRLRRHSDGGWTRFVLALFVMVWLNMAIQPCLMAAEALLPGQHDDCSHCPEAQHCSDIDESRCQFVGDYDYDGRAPAIPDPHAAFLVSTLPLSAEPAPERQAIDRWTRCGAGPDPGLPIYKRHCRYLN